MTGKRQLPAYSGDSWFLTGVSPPISQVVGGPSTLVLAVTRNGSGAGTVASSPVGILCGTACSEPYANPAAVTLTATPDVNSIFTGWLGACVGIGPCNLNVGGPSSVSATFAPSSVGTPTIDVDGNSHEDALTDGLLMFRYLSGLTDAALTVGAIGAGSAPPTAADILQHLQNIKPLLDVDGDGSVGALTDGLMIIRYVFGLRGTALTSGALGLGATRTPEQIGQFIQSVMP